MTRVNDRIKGVWPHLPLAIISRDSRSALAAELEAT